MRSRGEYSRCGDNHHSSIPMKIKSKGLRRRNQ
jgi:hypothetical protein